MLSKNIIINLLALFITLEALASIFYHHTFSLSIEDLGRYARLIAGILIILFNLKIKTQNS